MLVWWNESSQQTSNRNSKPSTSGWKFTRDGYETNNVPMARYVVPGGGAHAEEVEVGLMVSVSLMHAQKDKRHIDIIRGEARARAVRDADGQTKKSFSSAEIFPPCNLEAT